jgi:hypothetical protein
LCVTSNSISLIVESFVSCALKKLRFRKEGKV